MTIPHALLHTYTSIWAQAKSTELGLVIPILDPATAGTHASRFYDARTRLADPDLAAFSVFVPADGSKILLIRKLDNALP